eukprot:GGOE01021792.1.p1 GENE.GGOE01021792.1~~GGOE01021792.1.p1  ORF type:complete len:410 (+),score=63.08 GGOE01021792.1:38-1267(+)
MAAVDFSCRSSISSVGPDVDSHRDFPLGGRFSMGADVGGNLNRSSSFTSESGLGGALPFVPFSWLRDGKTGLETPEASEVSVGGRKGSLVKGPGRKTSVIPDPASLGTGSGVFTSEYTPGEVTLAKYGVPVDAPSSLDSPFMDIVWETASEAHQKASPSKDVPSPSWSQASGYANYTPRPSTPTRAQVGSPNLGGGAPSALHNHGSGSRRSSSVHFADQSSSVYTPPSARRPSGGVVESDRGHFEDWSVFLASESRLPSYQPKSIETKVTTYTSSYSKPYAATTGPHDWTTHETTFTSNSITGPTWTSRSFSTTMPDPVALQQKENLRRPSLSSASGTPQSSITRHSVVEEDWSAFHQTDNSPMCKDGVDGLGQFSSPSPSPWAKTDTSSLPRTHSWSFHSVRRSSLIL